MRILAALVDHLWQSTLFGLGAWGLAWLTRRHLPSIRSWLWRIAALKFVLPFALLYAIGEWLGCPVRHSAVPPPAVVVTGVKGGLTLFAPAQSSGASIYWLVAGIVLVVLASSLVGWRVIRELRPSTSPPESADRPPPGFLVAALLSATALVSVAAPIISGAVMNRLWRQEVLAADTRSMLSAKIDMVEADPRLGPWSSTIATPDGVLIRNINLQDLVAMTYGIGQFEVFGGALPWLESPRYDVHVTSAVSAPEVFDPYSLRQPVTQYLAERFGASIRVNGSCQEPCIRQESFVIERLR